MGKEIIIKNGKTEITITNQAIFVSVSDVLINIMSDENSISVTTSVKDRIECPASGKCHTSDEAVSAKSNALASESH